METWDDVRFFLAVTRYGSIRGAANALKVNHTTVSRRLRNLETSLGSRLLQRTPDGYTLTDQGRVVFKAGEAIEREILGAKQQVEDSDAIISGIVSITLTDLLLSLLAPTFADLCHTHLSLQLQLSVTPQVADLARRDADLALRFVQQPPGDLIGRQLASMPVALYGGKSLIRKQRKPDPLKLPWIRWQKPWAQDQLEAWPNKQYPGAPIAAFIDSYQTLEQMVASGAGVALLTPWCADKRKDLVRLTDNIDELAMDVWLLMHPDLRGVRRVSIITEALATFFRNL